ncbi:hypothetical protein JX266_004490 [Neoarthrinium moseri]|uniref:uncharacterized protein n=1 Tax=Neoarthrinium moseri TaxID=1658444 RepID=UPI001FDDDF76|nr:uncharacterized protein JN550_002229 [Neoarthrinium moseri]KAI1850111.1 hypothetical protein JX266_004490 [Neoarthrinium moseri]KAI1874800.1 hypothetical protein JN550_002229 [Neoarthrinium moseri]
MEEPQVQDPYKVDGPYIEATDWALPYQAAFLRENNTQNIEMYKHVNCGYLSTPGRPPTLAALKKHAQSLTHLIAQIAPSQGPGEINNKHAGEPCARSFVAGEAFDWLNDLEEPYKSLESQHHRPLNSLVNITKHNSDTLGVEFHCPLEDPTTKRSVKAEDAKWLAQRGQEEADYQEERLVKPFARHWNILRHANDCLEILDHEFSSTGGLLSILPTEHEVEAEQLDIAKNTLIGQWLVFTQQLVARMHDLEIAYANSLELLGGEAVIPLQHMSAHGPDGRSGREIVFPQDRWILANAGDDVLGYLHQVLDKKQDHLERTESEVRAMGVSGETLHDVPTDSERGIVSVDLITRFYRLKGSGSDRGPIFILPAFADRPGTKYTRMMEDRPTVVSMMAPKFPERLSEWESKNKNREDVRRDLFMKTTEQAQHVHTLQKEKERLESEIDLSRLSVENMRASVTPAQANTAQKLDQLQKELQESKAREEKVRQRAEAAEAQVQSLMPNNFSWTELAGTIPRDLDGNVTERALKALLQSLKKSNDDNLILQRTVGSLQSDLRANKSAV